MGSFDVLCSISRIPITDLDDAVEIYVGANTDPTKHDTESYYPIMLPLHGKYNDYGELNEVSTDSVGWKMLQYLMQNDFGDVVLPNSMSASPYQVFKDNVHYSSSQILPDSWAHASSEFTTDENGHHTIISGNGTIVNKTFIHKSIFDYFVNYSMTTQITYGDTPYLTGNDLLTQIPEYVDAIIDRLTQLANTNETTLSMSEIGKLIRLKHPVANMTLHCDNEKFNDRHPLNLIIFDNVGSGYCYMHHNALQSIRTLIDNSNINPEHQRTFVIEIMEQLLMIYAFCVGLKRHGQNVTSFVGFAPGQWQEQYHATDMIKMFNMFEELQQRKLDTIIRSQEEY